jgi:hypothetical protein
MRPQAPFKPDDLAELDERLLNNAIAVVPMSAVHGGQVWNRVIAMRHDVDNVIEPAVAFAAWEAERGYRSTYYVLHTAPYWRDKRLLRESLEMIVEQGHDLGIHNNSLSVAVATGMDPRQVLASAVGELRDYGFDINSTVAHGDALCYGADGKVRFVNDEMFDGCARSALGEPDRTVGGVTLNPVPLSMFGLEFDANWLPRDRYLSDSGGRWSAPFEETAASFPYEGQLHMLIHADWWGEAFVGQEIAA